MARIAGVDLPREKQIMFALPYIYGIGRPTAKLICTQQVSSRTKSCPSLTMMRLRD